MPPVTSEGQSVSVSSVKLITLGILVSAFATPVVGLMYVLFFVFNKETRRIGYIVLAGAVIVLALEWILSYWLYTHGFAVPSGAVHLFSTLTVGK